MNEKKYEIDMSRGPMLMNLLRFAMPLLLTGVLQLFYNAADIVVVGRFSGSDSLAAVGSTGSAVNLIINIFTGLSVGTAVAVSKAFGANDVKELSRTVHTSFLLSIILGIFVGVLGFFISKPLLHAMGTPDNVMPKASLYLKIYFAGMPLNMIYVFGTAILRSVGDTKRPLYYSAVSGILNIVLNLIFVIFFKMDVAGVATATIIAQALSGILVIKCLTNSVSSYRVDIKSLKIHKDELLLMIRIGLPAGLQGTVFSLSNVVIQSSVNLFGSVIMAGNAAAANLEGFIYISMNSLYHAALTMSGQNYGAGNFKRIKHGTLLCSTVVTCIGLSLGMLFLVFGRQMLGIYSTDPAVISAGMDRAKIIFSTYFLCGLMEAMVGSLRGLGYSVMPMIVSLLGACGLRLLWIFTIFAADKTTSVLYLSYPVSWFITTSVHLICLVFALRKRRREYELSANQI